MHNIPPEYPYKEYYDNPIEEGFDERIISSITEGRQDIQPRIKASKSQDELLAILNQPTFWAGEEVAVEELMKWSRGYGDFPQYYRQLDYFKDMTPREIAVHRMEIHKDRIENKKEFDNATKAISKGNPIAIGDVDAQDNELCEYWEYQKATF